MAAYAGPKYSLIVVVGKDAEQTPRWEAKWRTADGRQVKRRVGSAFLDRRDIGTIDRSAPVLEGWRQLWVEPLTPTGRPRRAPDGSGLLSYTDADARAKELIAGHAEDRAEQDRKAAEAANGGPVLFRAVCDAWLAEREQDVQDEFLKLSSLIDYRSMLRPLDYEGRPRARKGERGEKRAPVSWIRSSFDKRPIKDIGLADIERFEGRLRKGGLSVRTRKKYMTVLNMIFEFARTHKTQRVIDHNPIADLPKPKRHKKPKTTPKFYKPDVVERIAVAAKAPFGDMIRLAALTGLRQGELLALKWEDINFSGRKIMVEHTFGGAEAGEGSPKSGAARKVPMSDRAGAVLDGLSRRDEWTGPADLVFGERDGNRRPGKNFRPYVWTHLDGSTVRREYAKARDKAIATEDPKLAALPFHTLRHIFGSSCAAAGVPLSKIQEWMGHADIATTMIYIRDVPSETDADLLTLAQSKGTAADLEKNTNDVLTP